MSEYAKGAQIPSIQIIVELIAKRQRLLSTGEKPRVGAEDSKVIVRAAGAGEFFARRAARAAADVRPDAGAAARPDPAHPPVP